jgi:hypothetical protein
MYSIFHPLDANERLPRELILEGRRHRWLEMRHLEVIGFLYLPALILTIILLGSLSMVVAVAVAGIALLGIFAFVLSVNRR